MARRVLLALTAVVLVASTVMAVEAAPAQMPMHHFPYPTPIAQGCALCRGTGNCSQAVDNATAGVYCGDLITTYQPCCCQYRNECMTTIFSERCECLTDEEVEQFMSARFTVFCIFTVLFWFVLIWDRMCGRPYKVANSNRHHALAASPSVARLVGGAAPRETARDQELLEVDDHDRGDDEDAAAIEAALDAQADEVGSSPRRAQRRTSDRGDDAADNAADGDAVVLTMREDDDGEDTQAHQSTRTNVGSIQSV